jgi:hypothetical protein
MQSEAYLNGAHINMWLCFKLFCIGLCKCRKISWSVCTRETFLAFLAYNVGKNGLLEWSLSEQTRDYEKTFYIRHWCLSANKLGCISMTRVFSQI